MSSIITSQYNSSSSKSPQTGYGQSKSSSSTHSSQSQSTADPRGHSHTQSSKYGPQRTTRRRSEAMNSMLLRLLPAARRLHYARPSDIELVTCLASPLTCILS
ncbi:hypothetical protein BS17DRAFT_881674 [Gyrodon lividus]|nr:hypothetical protein BS17DRAFT_881674 [Gyrodon lividus]